MYEFPVCRFPEEAGVSSKGVLTFVKKALESKLGYHSVVVLRHGKVAAKINFAPYDDKTPHVMYSLSKTFCSAACGFAVAEGLLSWDSKVVDVLPELRAMSAACGCGVRLLGTAHGKNREDLCRRKLYRDMMDEGVFESLVTISVDGGVRRYKVEELK